MLDFAAMSSEVVAALLGAIVGAFFSFIGEPMKRAWYSPRLRVLFDDTDPVDVHLTRVSVTGETPRSPKEADALYLRVRVANDGESTAHNVELILQEVRTRERAAARFTRRPEFLPMNLVWSHRGDVSFGAIPPGVARHCDVLR